MLRTALLLLAALPLQAADPVIARAGDKDITASQIQPYLAKVSPSERDALLQNPAALNRQAYLERLQAKSPVTINEIALPGLLSTDTKK